MQIEYRIRKAIPSDTRGIINVLRNAFAPKYLRYSIYKSPLSENYLIECIKSSISGWSIFVAEQSNNILGTFIAQDHSEGWFLNHIAVSPLVENSGIGGNLLQHFEQEGRHRGAEKAILDVFESYPKALAWYYSKGYELISRSNFVVILIGETTINEGPKFVVTNNDLRTALNVERRKGFSNVEGFCHGGKIKVGLIAGNTLRLISWEVVSQLEAINATLCRFGGDREELIILGASQIPLGFPLINEISIRLSKAL